MVADFDQGSVVLSNPTAHQNAPAGELFNGTMYLFELLGGFLVELDGDIRFPMAAEVEVGAVANPIGTDEPTDNQLEAVDLHVARSRGSDAIVGVGPEPSSGNPRLLLGDQQLARQCFLGR